MSGLKYSLAPTARCPFGWPATPNYPIDPSPPSRRTSSTTEEDDVVMTDGTAVVDGLGDAVNLSVEEEVEPGKGHESLEEEIGRRYYEALFDDSNARTRSPILPLARRLRALSTTPSRPSLETLYRSLILPEDFLARKWRLTVPDLVHTLITGETPEPQAETKEEPVELGTEERGRLEEAVRKRQRAVDKGRPTPVATSSKEKVGSEEAEEEEEKVSFVKPPPVRDWVDGWAAREAQLQSLLILELLVLRPSSSSQPPLIPTPHATTAPSSPSKSKRPPLTRKGVSFSDDPKEKAKGVIDLELLLEALVDRMAMWQVIGGMGEALLGDLFGAGKGKEKAGGKGEGRKDEAEMDEVQRFWTDVVEEYYADSIPSLTPSLRPKLFPTSFLTSSHPSSLIPTPFRSRSKPSKPSIERTPNLKSLERKALERKGRERMEEGMSPTMAKLLGAPGAVGALKRSRSGVPVEDTQSQGGAVGRVNSRSLFSRRQVSMARKPSKAKMDLGPPPPPSVGVGVWGQKNLRVPKVVPAGMGQKEAGKNGMSDAAARRKQTSPRKSQPGSGSARTLVLATPQLARGGSGSFARVVAAERTRGEEKSGGEGEDGKEEEGEEGKKEGKVLVPGTPAVAARSKTSLLLVPDTPA